MAVSFPEQTGISAPVFFFKNLITCSQEVYSLVVRDKLYIVGVGG